MSRKRHSRITEEECEAADLERDLRRRCEHYNCRPIRWHWNGKPAEMICDECNDTNYLEETP